MALHEEKPPAQCGGANPLHVDNPALAAGIMLPHTQLGDDPLPADTALRLVRDELMLDGNARLNLATFVTTWMEPEAGRLMAECVDKNMIDKDEYPQTAELERRCVTILADLWNAPDPTAVMGANAQVCWEKFCEYWEVEPRLVSMDGDRFHLTADEAVARCDENTIGVVAILGSTFDGSYEPIAEITAALDALQERTGLDIPVHVDGASGAMIAPFLDPDLVWDFRLPRVASINTSGHKYGLVYPGVGWAIWRYKAALPSELVFNVNYLGGDMPTFALNFSRPGAEVAAQYYTFVRLGRDGFPAVQQASRDVAMYLASGIEALGPFSLLTLSDQLPVFAFTVKPDAGYTVFDVSRRLRERGWLVPAYTFPENRTDLAVLRIVVRNGFTRDLADLLLAGLGRVVSEGVVTTPASGTAFHH